MSFLKPIPRQLPPHTVAIVRVDFNVPLTTNGTILDSARITNHLPTLKFLKRLGCKIILLAHLGKPRSNYRAELSFAPLLPQLKSLLQDDVDLQTLETIHPQSTITLLDNIRFYQGEENNDSDFSQKLASLGTVYINDAFSVCHRSHASTVGIAQYLPSYAGFALQSEFNSLATIFHNPKSPVTLILGGKKVSDKIGVLEHLITRVDQVLVGGACANTFLQAQGKDIGQSYSEANMVPVCRELLDKYENKIVLPVDFVTDKDCNLDIGSRTIKAFQSILEKSHTIIWAGPMGKYEEAKFRKGTISLLTSITQPGVLSIIGGGDTIAALKNEAALHQVSLVSLGGSAMLEFLAKEHLPGTDCLLA